MLLFCKLAYWIIAQQLLLLGVYICCHIGTVINECLCLGKM